MKMLVSLALGGLMALTGMQIAQSATTPTKKVVSAGAMISCYDNGDIKLDILPLKSAAVQKAVTKQAAKVGVESTKATPDGVATVEVKK